MKVTAVGVLLICLLAVVQQAWPQTYVVAVAEENLRASPNGAKLGTLKKGAAVAAVSDRGRWVKASLRGWIWKPSVDAGRRGSRVTVTVARENVRESPSAGAQLLGTVLRGTDLRKVGERKSWLQIAYDGWIWEPSLTAVAQRAPPQPTNDAEAAPPPSRNPDSKSTGLAASVGGKVGALPGGIERTLKIEEENLRAAPNGTRLGILRRGADLAVLSTQGQWLRVATRGYFYGASAKGSGASRTVSKTKENLREAPGSEIVGVLERGAPLRVLGKSGGWLEVELEGWIWAPSTLALDPTKEGDTASTATTAENSARGEGDEEDDDERDARGTRDAGNKSEVRVEKEASPTATDDEDDRRVRTPSAAGGTGSAAGRTLVRSVEIKDGPDGSELGEAQSGAAVTALRSDGDWVKVRLEGWVPKDALRARSTAGAPTVAMVVTDPDKYRGSETTWPLELIAVLEADRERRDFKPGEHYLLTRSAIGEREYVYVVIPEKMTKRFEKLRPFSPITVKGVVRTGRSSLVGNPILELGELVKSERKESRR